MISPACTAEAKLPGPRLPLLRWRPGWREAVEGFVRALVEKGYSSYTIRDYRQDVMRLGNYLDIGPGELTSDHFPVISGLLEAEGVSLGVRRRRLSAYARFLEWQEAEAERPRVGPALLAAATFLDPPERAMLGLIYLGGLRLTEVAALEGRDIRTRKRSLLTRTGYRIVPLHPRLHRILLDLRRLFPFVTYRPLIPGADGFPLNSRTLHGRFQRIVAAAGFPELKPDALRREAAAFLAREGTPAGLVHAFLGKDRGRPLAPRHGRLVDLTCLADRLSRLPA